VIRDAKEAARRSLSQARSEAAESILRARDRLLGRVRAALGQRMPAAIGDPAYRAVVADELAGALERLPRGRVVVRARPELAGVLSEAVRDRQDVVVEAATDLGVGFVAASPEAGMEIDATLAQKLVHQWPRIAVAMLAEIGT
jgi:vacuolar-type H+-ATPase subunit E/Vma4